MVAVADYARLIPPVCLTDRRPNTWRWWALGAISAAILVAEILLSSPALPPSEIAVGAASLAALVVQRRFPGRALALVAAASVMSTIVLALTDSVEQTTASVIFVGPTMLFVGARWLPGPRHILGVGLTVVVLAVVQGLATTEARFESVAVELVLNGLVVVVALVVRNRSYIEATRREAAEAQERNELAADIHDSVAHHMSAIAIRAEAARMIAPADGELHEALTEIKVSASTALNDMRQLVASIHSDLAATAPMPGFADIAKLCRRQTDAEVSIEFDLQLDEATIQPTIASVAYYVTREAITNSRRHGRNASLILVKASEQGDEIVLTIRDNGTGTAAHQRQTKTGFGIRGMRERAQAIGGRISAGPTSPTGWLVAAHLPREVQ